VHCRTQHQDGKADQLPSPVAGYFCAHLAQRDPRDHSTLKPPQGLAQWFNCV